MGEWAELVGEYPGLSVEQFELNRFRLGSGDSVLLRFDDLDDDLVCI